MSDILLIDDREEMAHLVMRTLRSEAPELTVHAEPSANAALAFLATRPLDCVLLDYRLPDATGLDCLREIRRRHPDMPVVVITAYGSEEVAVEAMRLGASNYLVKHKSWLANVAPTIREVLGQRTLRTLNGPAPVGPGSKPRLNEAVRARYAAKGIIGDSPAIAQAIDLAEKAAASRTTVLLQGETGTGKELFAHAIHEHGARARRPFVAVNCAGFQETLLESELFGYVKGAFTGADGARPGLLEEANGGTVFLDEIGEMGSNVQAKLLRVLEERQVRPLGSNASRHLDVRIIAATNRTLRAAGTAGGFRSDLFFRLDQFPIRLPPLRERRQDVRTLARHFLHTANQEHDRHILGFEPATLRHLERYEWPGNVRQLKNEINRLVVAADDHRALPPSLLSANILAGDASAVAQHSLSLREILDNVATAVILDRLRHFNYNRLLTAGSLDLSREVLWGKMHKLGIHLPPRGDGLQ